MLFIPFLAALLPSVAKAAYIGSGYGENCANGQYTLPNNNNWMKWGAGGQVQAKAEYTFQTLAMDFNTWEVDIDAGSKTHVSGPTLADAGIGDAGACAGQDKLSTLDAGRAVVDLRSTPFAIVGGAGAVDSCTCEAWDTNDDSCICGQWQLFAWRGAMSVECAYNDQRCEVRSAGSCGGASVGGHDSDYGTLGHPGILQLEVIDNDILTVQCPDVRDDKIAVNVAGSAFGDGLVRAGQEPSKCFDGIRSSSSNFCHSDVTDMTNEFLRVDLGFTHDVTDFRLQNRQGLEHRLADFKVYVGSSAGGPLAAGNTQCHSATVGSVAVVGGYCVGRGRYVYIYYPGTNRIINLAEVEVFGTQYVTASPTASPTTAEEGAAAALADDLGAAPHSTGQVGDTVYQCMFGSCFESTGADRASWVYVQEADIPAGAGMGAHLEHDVTGGKFSVDLDGIRYAGHAVELEFYFPWTCACA